MGSLLKPCLVAIMVVAFAALPFVVLAASSYEDLRALPGSVGQVETLTASAMSGTFAFATADPHGAGDDGGIVIKAPNGWWIRQFAHTIDDPIELDWYQLSDGESISALLSSLAGAYAPRLYVRMPNSNITLRDDSGFVNWSADYGIHEFALLEADAETELELGNPDLRTAWQFEDMSVLVIGSNSAKDNRDDHRLTIIGPWKWDQRGETDESRFVGSVGMITVIQSADNNADLIFRFDSKYPMSCTVYVGGHGDRNTYFSGVHRFGGCLSTGGQYSGRVHFEDAYVSDELGFGFGWEGRDDGDISRAIAHWNGQRSTQVAGGGIAAETLEVTGKVTAQYGNAGFNFFFVDKLGSSEEDPFLLNIRDYGWTGPNELGKPVGVALGDPIPNVHPIKSDGLGEAVPGWRYVYVREQNQWGKNPKLHRRIWFAENAQCDDNPNCRGTYTTNTTWTYANADGSHYYQNGTHVDDRIGDNVVQGDGLSPAMTDGMLVLVHNDTARYGQFHDIFIQTVTDQGPPYFDDGSGNAIENVTLSGMLSIAPSEGSNSARNLTFIGAQREVIKIGGGATLEVDNVCAPSGSTVGGDGVLMVAGSPKTLPYTLEAADCKNVMADIPINPYFGPKIPAPKGLHRKSP